MSIRALVILGAVATAGVTAALTTPAAYGSHCSTLLTTLSGVPLNGATPTGKGDWRGTPACTGVDLRVEVRDVAVPNGTVVTLDTCGRQMAVSLNNREARFEIRGSAPTCTVGQAVTVRVGTTTVASGTWCNPLFARCDWRRIDLTWAHPGRADTLERDRLAGFYEDFDNALFVETVTVDGWRPGALWREWGWQAEPRASQKAFVDKLNSLLGTL